MKKEIKKLMLLIKEYLLLTEGKKILDSYHSPNKIIHTKLISEEDNENIPLKRSLYNTEIIKVDEKDNQIFSVINEALEKPSDYIREYKKDIYIIKEEIQNITNNIYLKYKSNKLFCSILYDNIGYKTNNINDNFVKFSESKYLEIFYDEFIYGVICDYFENKKIFNISNLSSINIDEWYEFYISQFKKITSKKKYEYDIIFYLNSPFCPNLNINELGYLNIEGQKLKLYTTYVTDYELNRLENEFIDKSILNYINTKIYYKVYLPIDSEVYDFEKLYSDAIEAGRKMLTNLRIAYEFEIGIFTIKVKPKEKYTPEIRNKYNYEFNSKYSAYFPKRQIFYTNSNCNTFTEKSFSLFKNLNKTIHQKKWLDIAIKRFNIAIDNYNNNNIERLLDIAIAFEAIYLNDNESTKELSNRLSLRAAKFLGKSLESRKNIYKIFRDIYTYRSKIAHGDNIDSFKSKDKERINEINDYSLILLKMSIIKIYKLLGKNINWKEYWEDLVLR